MLPSTTDHPQQALHRTQLNSFFEGIHLFAIIVFLHALGRLTCSGIDTLPPFPGASTLSHCVWTAIYCVSTVNTQHKKDQMYYYSTTGLYLATCFDH
jgi:hypothetical protein